MLTVLWYCIDSLMESYRFDFFFFFVSTYYVSASHVGLGDFFRNIHPSKIIFCVVLRY